MNNDLVFVVFEQNDLMLFTVTKIFRNESDAEKFCQEQNDINKPEYDSYGYFSGIYHSYTPMKLE